MIPKLLPPQGTPVVNALAKQRAMLENVMRACVGLAPENNMVREEGGRKEGGSWCVCVGGGYSILVVQECDVIVSLDPGKCEQGCG